MPHSPFFCHQFARENLPAESVRERESVHRMVMILSRALDRFSPARENVSTESVHRCIQNENLLTNSCNVCYMYMRNRLLK